MFLLTLIGLVASFYSPPVIFRLKTKVYMNTYSPYCMNWTGTYLLRNLLENKSIKVQVVENASDLKKTVNEGGLILIIAPDKQLDDETVEYIYNGFINGTINVAVFDENTTSNKLLEKFNISIDGRAVFHLFDPKYQYPEATLYSLNGSSYIVRLNWASIINRENGTLNGTVKAFAIVSGILDSNDNGKLDQNDTFVYSRETGIIVDQGYSKLIVFSDSFPLTNLAIGRKYLVSTVLVDYIIELAKEKGSRVIIPNYIYKAKYVTQGMRYHVGFLFLNIANYITFLDQNLTLLIMQNKFILLLLAIALTIVLIPLIRYLLKMPSIENYKVSNIISKKYIIKSFIARDLLDKSFLVGRRKIIINNLWSLVTDTYKKLRGLDLEYLVSGEKYDLLGKYGFSNEEIKELKWMYALYLKVNKKTILPLILNWRKSIFKYIYLVEKYLNKPGYTLVGKRGFKNVTRLFI